MSRRKKPQGFVVLKVRDINELIDRNVPQNAADEECNYVLDNNGTQNNPPNLFVDVPSALTDDEEETEETNDNDRTESGSLSDQNDIPPPTIKTEPPDVKVEVKEELEFVWEEDGIKKEPESPPGGSYYEPTTAGRERKSRGTSAYDSDYTVGESDDEFDKYERSVNNGKRKISDVDDDPDYEFEVEKIIGDRISKDGKRQYKIRWEGYDSDEDTWENESNLNCDELIERYNNRKALMSQNRQPRGRPRAVYTYSPQSPVAVENAAESVDDPPEQGSPKPPEPTPVVLPTAEDQYCNKRKIIPKGKKEPSKIVGIRVLPNGRRSLLVHWKDLSYSFDSWVAEDSIRGTDAYRAFLESQAVANDDTDE